MSIPTHGGPASRCAIGRRQKVETKDEVIRLANHNIILTPPLLSRLRITTSVLICSRNPHRHLTYRSVATLAAFCLSGGPAMTHTPSKSTCRR